MLVQIQLITKIYSYSIIGVRGEINHKYYLLLSNVNIKKVKNILIYYKYSNSVCVTLNLLNLGIYIAKYSIDRCIIIIRLLHRLGVDFGLLFIFKNNELLDRLDIFYAGVEMFLHYKPSTKYSLRIKKNIKRSRLLKVNF